VVGGGGDWYAFGKNKISYFIKLTANDPDLWKFLSIAF